MALSNLIIMNVSYHGTSHQIDIASQASLRELCQRLLQITGCSINSGKLFTRQHKGALHLSTLTEDNRPISVYGITNGSKLMLVGSSQQEIDQVNRQKEDTSLIGIEEELVRAARRKRSNKQTPQAPTGKYTFQSYQPWTRPGLNPPPSKALELLHRLASDRGIIHIMTSRKWSVGKLSEMPPEGLVGISPVCILGVNINMGQEISLRLRTDDLKGFRKYHSIRQTLVHELTHMVFSEHDNNFKELNSQLLRECMAYSEPHAVRGGVGVYEGPSELDQYIVQGTSVQKVGTSTARPGTERQNAAAAALARAQRAQAQHHTKEQQDQGGTVPQDQDSCSDGHSSDEHYDPVTEAKELAAMELGGIHEQAVNSEAGKNPRSGLSVTTGDGEAHDQHAHSVHDQQVHSVHDQQVHSVHDQQVHSVHDQQLHSIDDQQVHSIHDQPVRDVVCTAESSDMPDCDGGTLPAQHAEQHVLRASHEVEQLPSNGALCGGDAMVGVMQQNEGSQRSRDGATSSAQACDGREAVSSGAVGHGDDIDTMAVMGSSDTAQYGTIKDSTGIEGGSTGGQPHQQGEEQSGDMEWSGVDDVVQGKVQQCQALVSNLVQRYGRGQAGVILKTLIRIMDNLIQQPNEQKYKSISTSSNVYQRHIGSHSEAREILQLSGFQVVDNAQVFKRNDIGLVWVISQVLQESV